MDKLLTIDQVADVLGVHRDTVTNLIRSGRLIASQLGGHKSGWRIYEEDLEAFIRANRYSVNGSNGSTKPENLDDFERRQDGELAAFQESQRQSRRAYLERG